MDEIYLGKIVNTHGIKGELRILSDFPYKEQVFQPGTKIYIGNQRIPEVIETYRFHKIFDMITLKGYTDINEVLKYKGEEVYIDSKETPITGMLDKDYIGLEIVSHGVIKGKVVQVEKGPQKLLVVERNGKKSFIPLVDAFIKKIDLENQKIEIEEIEGLLNEN